MGIVGLSKSIALDMAKFNVRSNCIAPWAWTAMTATIPRHPGEHRADREDEEDGGRQDRAAGGVPGQRCGRKVSGQIFGVRANEIYFFSQIRMIRSVHRSEGWTPETIAEHAMPAFESSFSPTCPR